MLRNPLAYNNARILTAIDDREPCRDYCHLFHPEMSDLVTPTPSRPVEEDGGTVVRTVAESLQQPVVELGGESASPPPANFYAVINVKCPDQTGVVRM